MLTVAQRFLELEGGLGKMLAPLSPTNIHGSCGAFAASRTNASLPRPASSMELQTAERPASALIAGSGGGSGACANGLVRSPSTRWVGGAGTTPSARKAWVESLGPTVRSLHGARASGTSDELGRGALHRPTAEFRYRCRARATAPSQLLSTASCFQRRALLCLSCALARLCLVQTLHSA